MITAILILYFALSACVSVVLIAACALSGRLQEQSQALSLCESSEALPAVAEMQIAKMQVAEPQRPMLQLQTSLSAQ